MKRILAPAAITACLVACVLPDTAKAAPSPYGFSENSVLTWYVAAGYGACGTQIDARTGLFAAVPATYWTTPKHADDPLCEQGVQISYRGKTIKIPIRDLCSGCAADQLDLSRPAFAQFENPNYVTRITDATWRVASLKARPSRAADDGRPGAGRTQAARRHVLVGMSSSACHGGIASIACRRRCSTGPSRPSGGVPSASRSPGGR
ncbi:RlpA-like double-psi beta-barrel domain-containing protein [Sphaerimonospora thailandensis]|uniref:RlpA-like protein double-psi beta-barrel domain-containing protein n=1 Tax=Sphaerimonospora thailandensis TaxID=795644 RepID=A0A8J3RA07_9ACTN|nr:hypothetical protein [Sphaerimonospora thailandensis]GIH70107.1 hypothetical protein Mth01_23600 [Sphaerimonospora thailandensis]